MVTPTPPNVAWPLMAGWRWTIPKSRSSQPQICHRPHLKDERQTQEERETDGGETGISGSCRRRRRRWRRWRKEEKRSRRVRLPHLHGRASSLHAHPLAHPWQTSTAKHQREEKRSARDHGVPPRGKAFLNPSLHTHIHTRCSHSHSTCPLDLTIKTQEQISWLVTAAQKQMMPNTWLLYGLFCREAWESLSRRIWHSTCANIFRYWKCS